MFKTKDQKEGLFDEKSQRSGDTYKRTFEKELIEIE